MPVLLKDETLIETWHILLEENFKSDIETLAASYPKDRSLYLDYSDLDKINTSVSDKLINQPYIAIFNAEESFKQIDTAIGTIEPHLRIVNLPAICKHTIRELRSEHAGTLVSVEGIVKKNTPVKAKIVVGSFLCQKCGCIIKVAQDEEILKEPTECYADQGGCERVSTFKLINNLSSFIDAEKLQLQENPEGLKGREQPRNITIYLEDDLTGKIHPGDRVHINGILNTSQKRRGTFKLTNYDFVIDAISVEVKQSAYEDIIITDEDEKLIKKASKDPEIYDKMIGSIAPSIYGLSLVKEALLYQLFGGNRKVTNDDIKIRGDIHILLLGDPGTAKSQLLLYVHNLAPCSIITSGGGSTKAGLTATAVKDEFSEGQWVLEAGAMVLADQGLACIDEFDKMHEEDRSSIHQAMEQQEISIAKAGINVTLKSRCSVVACANPKLGRFDVFAPLYDQFNMQPTLLSRFDLIFPILDKPDKKKDRLLAEHILKTHQDPKGKHIKPCFEPDFIRKYVAYAKKNIQPKLTEGALNKIKEYYVSCRNTLEDNIPFTPRQLEAFVRIAEASAKVRLSKEVKVADAERSIKIVKNYLNLVSIDRETGKIDIDIIATGISHSQHDRMRIILDKIINICNESEDNFAGKNEIIIECESEGIVSDKVEDALKRMKKNGQIYEPKPERYRVTEF